MKRIIASIAMAAATFVVSPAIADDAANPDLEYEAAKDIIWNLELGIYEGRGNGDLTPYVENLAAGYSAWPPHMSTPNDAEAMKQAVDGLKGIDQEELDMEFVSFTLNGTTAIIYYQTHMTRTGAGNPIDARYEVTHTWTYEDGAWKVLGGMARARPDRN